jgi:hypothetical protein
MDSNAIVGPLELFAIAKELLAAPPLAQPPRPQAIASRTAAMAARAAIPKTRNEMTGRSCINQSDIVKID